MTKREIIRLSCLLAAPFAGCFVAGLALAIITMALGFVCGVNLRGSDGLGFATVLGALAGFVAGGIALWFGLEEEAWKEPAP